MSERMKIIRGEDQSFTLKVRTKDNQDPLDLTGMTKITLEMVKTNRTILSLSTATVPGVPASLKISDTLIFNANEPGAIGNEITLIGNGSLTVQQVVDAWNTENPANTVSFTGVGTGLMPDGMHILEGGYDSYIPLVVTGNPVLGKVAVTIPDMATKSLRLGLNQSFVLKVDFGPHPTGTRIVAQFKNQLDVVDPIGY